MTPREIILWAMPRGWRWRSCGGLEIETPRGTKVVIEFTERRVRVRVGKRIHASVFYCNIHMKDGRPRALLLGTIRGLPESAGGRREK